MPYIYKEIEVDVELEDFEDSDLLEELEKRGVGLTETTSKETLQKLYDMYTSNRVFQIDDVSIQLDPEFERKLVELFDIGLGRIA